MKNSIRIDRIKLGIEMLKQDISQKELAELTGVSRATINYIRSGKSCSKEVADKIAKALKVKLENIME